MYGTRIKNRVIVVALPDRKAQVFQFALGEYWGPWLRRLVKYWQEQDTPLAVGVCRPNSGFPFTTLGARGQEIMTTQHSKGGITNQKLLMGSNKLQPELLRIILFQFPQVFKSIEPPTFTYSIAIT